MKITHSLAQFQKEHVTMELECIDRMHLNAYVPKLTTEGGIAAFCRGYLGHRFASTKQAVAMLIVAADVSRLILFRFGRIGASR
jgi:hypothetical protein